jgi:ubiquinone/menaquinone biosynthesis C-methylase UbiE
VDTWFNVAMNEGHLVCDGAEWRDAVRDHMIPWALRDLDLGDDVLEVGPGYGATTDVFSKLLPRLTSIEIDPDLAAQLQDRYAGTPHVEVLVGDATQMPFPDGRFSGAVCFSMLHHVPSPELQNALFAEVARVLQPGAPVVALDSMTSDALREFHDGDTYTPIDPEGLPERLQRAGFRDIEVRVNEYAWTAMARRSSS